MSPKQKSRKGASWPEHRRLLSNPNQSKYLRNATVPDGSQTKTPRRRRVKRTCSTWEADRPAASPMASLCSAPCSSAWSTRSSMLNSRESQSIPGRGAAPAWARGSAGFGALRPRAENFFGSGTNWHPRRSSSSRTSRAPWQIEAPARSSATQPRPERCHGGNGTANRLRPSFRACAAALRAPLR